MAVTTISDMIIKIVNFVLVSISIYLGSSSFSSYESGSGFRGALITFTKNMMVMAVTNNMVETIRIKAVVFMI